MSRNDGKEFGGVVTAREGGDPLALDRDEVIGLLKQYGALLFRGFELGGEEMFRAFTEKYGANFLMHPTPERYTVSDDNTTKTVDRSSDALALHSEMSFLPAPLYPELIWFYCVKPDARGGQTILCDGTEIASELSGDMRRLLDDKGLTFTMQFTERLWQGYFNTKSPEVVVGFLKHLGVEKHFTLRDGKFVMTNKVPGLRKTKFGDAPAFVNNLIIFTEQPSDGITLTLGDGSPVPLSLYEELVRVTRTLTAEINWQPEDLLMFDNTRMLHGRREILDPERLIYARFAAVATFQ